MAQGFKTGGRNFEKGRSGNPNGRPGMPKEVREAMKMNKAEFAQLMLKYLQSSHSELKLALESKETKSLDKIVISIILNAIKKGDEKRLDFLMNRIVGKVTDKFEHSTPKDFKFKVEFVDPDETT